MKLFTLNAHSHTGELAKKRQALLEEFLIQEAPHIISLQEVNQSMSAPPMAKEKLPPSIIKVDGAPSVPIKEGNSALSLLLALRNAGHDYRLAWLPVKCGYGRLDEGLAILSRLPVTDASGFYISRTHSYDNWTTRMALSLRLCGECVTVCALHTSRYDDPDEPFIDQWERLRVALKDEGHLLLMGDFNIAPDNHLIDIIRERMVDTADFFDEPKLSFPSDRPRVKIDYIFVSPDVEVVKADVPAIVVSDHRPHTAEVNFK